LQAGATPAHLHAQRKEPHEISGEREHLSRIPVLGVELLARMPASCTQASDDEAARVLAALTA
jgi:hypothetical protein